MVDASKIKRELPYLNDYGKDIDSWIEDFTNVMEMYDIQEPARIFVWLKISVDADVKSVLKSLVTTRNNITRYPNYKEVQVAIEEYLEIKPADKCTVLKNLKIKALESIKNFNYKYLTLYHRLDRDFQKIISVDDYLNSIKSRIYIHSQILLAECNTLTDAFKVAVRAEKAERRTLESNESNSTSMVVQNINSRNNLLLEHPLYKGLLAKTVNTGDTNQNMYLTRNSGVFAAGRRNHERFNNSMYNNFNNNNKLHKKFNCFNCGQIGHKAFECPNIRNENSRNIGYDVYREDQNQLMTFGKFNRSYNNNEKNFNNRVNKIYTHNRSTENYNSNFNNNNEINSSYGRTNYYHYDNGGNAYNNHNSNYNNSDNNRNFNNNLNDKTYNHFNHDNKFDANKNYKDNNNFNNNNNNYGNNNKYNTTNNNYDSNNNGNYYNVNNFKNSDNYNDTRNIDEGNNKNNYENNNNQNSHQYNIESNLK